MYEAGVRCWYKGGRAEVILNEDGYIAIRRPNGAEVEPVAIADLSMDPPVQVTARSVIDEKQFARAYHHLVDADPLLLEAAKLEHRIASETRPGNWRPWDSLPFKDRMLVIAASKSVPVEQLYKEYR